MYEKFGSWADIISAKVTFRLFVPDNTLDPGQYSNGGNTGITGITVVGTFQDQLGETPWTKGNASRMTKAVFQDGGAQRGWLFEWVSPELQEGFYEYKYLVEFENFGSRLISDPCARYGGSTNQNSGIVVDKNVPFEIQTLTNRLPPRDLVIYEVMVDDFTKEFLQGRAPLDALRDKVDYFVEVGVNAVELMPWTAWPYDDYSWGYDPCQYFTVAHHYTLGPASPTDKLVYLKKFIDLCHSKGIHVLMDGVFNHAQSDPPFQGFPYFWLYGETAESPYVGRFGPDQENGVFQDLDYHNGCLLQYILDACLYWIDTFKIDGIRMDDTSGYYRPEDRAHGLPALMSALRRELLARDLAYFPLIMEHSWDFGAINATNAVGGTSCWLDPYRSRQYDMMTGRQINGGIMRLLNSNMDFGERRVPTVYLENHDHQTLAHKCGGRDQWWRAQPYLIALYCSPGAVLIHNGQEMALDNWMPEPGPEENTTPIKRVSPRIVPWALEHDDISNSLRGLLKKLADIRAAHLGLRERSFYPGSWDASWTQRDSDGFGADTAAQVVVFHRWQADATGIDRYYVVLNYSDFDQTVDFRLPENGTWTDLLSGWQIGVTDFSWQFVVGSHWGHIFHQWNE